MSQVSRKRVYKPEMKTDEEVRGCIKNALVLPKLTKEQKRSVDAMLLKQRALQDRLKKLESAERKEPAASQSAPSDAFVKWTEGAKARDAAFKELKAKIAPLVKRSKKRWDQRVRRGIVPNETIVELRRAGLLGRKRAA